MAEYRSKYTGAEVDALLDKVESGEVGGKVTVDSVLSTESENPVMNKVVTEELNKKLEGEVVGITSPTEGTVGGSYDDTELRNAITDLQAKDTETDEKLTELSEEIEHQGIFIEDLYDTKIDREADDYYPQLAVGLADNLAGVDVVDSEVNFRRSGGGAISDGVARIEAIKGNSVVWNQLFTLQYATLTSLGVKVSKNADNSLTCVGTLTDTYFNFGQFQSNIENHKYLFILDASAALDGYSFGLLNRNAQMKISGGFAYVFHTNSDISKGKYIGIRGLSVGNEINENLFVLQIDLTQMFQAGNEPTTIEEFYSRIPMGVDLNAYNEGEVIHMDVQSVESQGVNAWDEEWELGNISNGNDIADSNRIRSKNYIRVFPNKEYYVTTFASTQFNLTMYDADKQYVGVLAKANSFSHTMPSNVHYVRFAIGASSTPIKSYKEGICINLSDASINGKYFPYIKRVEDLGIIRKYFPQGMKSAGSAHDEIRYNKATQKWEMVQRIGEVDMGTLNWAKSGTYTNGYYALPLSGAKPLQYPICRLYSAVSVSFQQDKSIYVSNNGGQAQLFVIDSAYTDAASFKAAMSGVILYYELAKPIVTELDAEDQFKDLDYQVWNCGTERAIAEGISAPLAADITYGFNAIGKIKELEEAIKALQTKVASL